MTSDDLRSRPVDLSPRRIYVPIACLIALIAVVGFWPTYFGRLLTGTVGAVPIIHFHAAVLTGWLVLLIAQAALAATGRIALHMKVGKIGMGYGVIVIVISVATALSQFASRVEAGNFAEAQRRLFAPLTDMMVFPLFLGAACIYRVRPEVHKRLVVVATTILLLAAVSRMEFLGGRPPPLPLLLMVWMAPIYVAMVYDFVTRRLIHPVYVIGTLTLVLMGLRTPLRETQAWLSFTEWLAALVG